MQTHTGVDRPNNPIPRAALIASAAVFIFAWAYLSLVGARSHPDARRDAMMLRRHLDSSRTVHLRTDFPSFYYAAKAIRLGKRVYSASTLDSLAAADAIANHVLPYLYPPFLAIIAQPMAQFRPAQAGHIWDALQVALFSASLALLALIMPFRSAPVPGHWRVGALLACAGVLVFPFQQNIVFGQVNSLVLFFIVLSLFFSFSTRQEYLAGGALAVATLIKVTPAVLLMFFALNRKWKVLGGFAVGCTFFVLASLALVGATPWREFLLFLPEMGYARNVAGGFHPSIIANFSLAGFFMRLLPGEATAIRLLTIICVAVLAAILAHHHVRSTNNRSEQLLVLPYLVVMVVASPVTWLHHLVYVFPGVFLALRWSFNDQTGKCRWARIATFASLAVLSGVDFQHLYPSLPMSEVLRPWLTALNLWSLLLLFVASLVFSRRETSSGDVAKVMRFV